MPSLFDSLGSAARTGFCTLTAPAEATAALLGPIASQLPRSTGVDLAGDLLNAGRGARNSFCSVTPDNGRPGAPIPFDGGQCPGTTYLVSWTSDGPSRNNDGPYLGPVNIGPVLDLPSGLQAATISSVNPGTGETVLTNLFFSNQADPNSLVFTNVAATNGPNDCGNPPRNFPNYNAPDFTIDVPFSFDDDETGNSVNVTPTFVYAPIQIDANNTFNVPVRIEFEPEVFIDGTVDLSTGDFTVTNNNAFDFVINNNYNEIPPEQFDPGSGFIIVGVKIDSLFNPATISATATSQLNGATTLYTPRLANVYFQYQDDTGQVTLGKENPVKLSSQIIFAERAAIGAFVSPEEGVTATLNLLTVQANIVQSYW